MSSGCVTVGIVTEERNIPGVAHFEWRDIPGPTGRFGGGSCKAKVIVCSCGENLGVPGQSTYQTCSKCGRSWMDK